MKFYSEVTKKLYDTQDALVAEENEIHKQEEIKRAAEAEKQKKNVEMKKEAEEINHLLKQSAQLFATADKKLIDFQKKYGLGVFASLVGSSDLEKELKTLPKSVNKPFERDINPAKKEKEIPFEDLLNIFLS